MAVSHSNPAERITRDNKIGIRRTDAESRGMIYQGASVAQLGLIFNRSSVDVQRRLGIAGIQPIGIGQQGNAICRIKDTAAHLVEVPISEEQIIKYVTSLNPRQFPPYLSKVFWEAMIKRRDYEEQVGELWATVDVLALASEVFQSLRMSILLIPDNLRDETDMTEAQIAIVQKIVDNTLEEARVRLVSDIRKPESIRMGSGEPRSRVDVEDAEPL